MNEISINSKIYQSQRILKFEKNNLNPNNLTNPHYASSSNKTIPAIIDFGIVLTPLLLIHQNLLKSKSTLVFTALASLFPITHTLKGIHTPGTYLYSKISQFFNKKNS